VNHVNLHSFRVARLEILARDTRAPLGGATGFFCAYRGRTWLVTSWHVVSGRHYQTQRALHPSRALPGTLIVHAHVLGTPAASVPSVSTVFRLALYGADGQPRWCEHPLFGGRIDVAALDIGTAVPVPSIDLGRELARRITPAVTDQAFVTGYPLSATTTPNSLPIYKSGTIASEPCVFDSEPRFYIDGKTKTGMSGSPVMIKRAASRLRGERAHEALHFIGIYSGRDRQEQTEFEAELGIVWPYGECLLPILDARAPLAAGSAPAPLTARASPGP
jgi:hypothetical protein